MPISVYIQIKMPWVAEGQALYCDAKCGYIPEITKADKGG